MDKIFYFDFDQNRSVLINYNQIQFLNDQGFVIKRYIQHTKDTKFNYYFYTSSFFNFLYKGFPGIFASQVNFLQLQFLNLFVPKLS